MQDLNDCKFVGRFVNDPKMAYTSNTQTAVASFVLAIDRGKDKNGEDKGTDFPTYKAFGKIAENIERFFHKGDTILISKSHVQTGKYENKNGDTVFTTDFIVDSWQFMGSPKKNAGEEDYNGTYNWGSGR